MERQPSQGVAAIDIVDKYKKYDGKVSVEHKERHTWPVWFEQALDQAKTNGLDLNLVYYTLTKGRGKKSRTVLMIEITDLEDWRLCELVGRMKEAMLFPNEKTMQELDM